MMLSRCRLWNDENAKICKICGFISGDHINSLMSHLHNSHQIKRSDGSFALYVSKFFVAPMCACGCGAQTQLHSREFGYSMFAIGCKALDRCRNPSYPEFYLFKGMSVEETIEALRNRQVGLARKANTPDHLLKLSNINSGSNNPSSLKSVMERNGLDECDAKGLIKDQRKRSSGFAGRQHSKETKSRLAKLRAAQPKIVTRPELVVWGMLHAIGVNFEFQHPIDQYVVDFCVDERIVIDVFGDYWHNRGMKSRFEEKQASDIVKIEHLKNNGFVVHVLWESEVMTDPVSTVTKLRVICELNQSNQLIS